MRKQLINAAMPLAMVAASVLPASALAASPSPTTTPNCSVVAVGTKTSPTQSTQFTVNGDEVTANFKVIGDADCRQTVTVVTWTAPNGTDGKPYDQQKLFKHFTGTYAPGEHTITTDLPHCFWQADLVRGNKPTAPDGGPQYTGGMFISGMHGGTKACVTPTPSVTPSASPTPTGTPQVQGDSTSTLPDTGAAAAGGVVGLSSMIGAGYMYIRARRNFKK